MAGVCVGVGLFGGPDGPYVYGPVSEVYNATGAGCGVSTNNGIRTDPVSQKLWSPPDTRVAFARDFDVAKPDVTPTFAHDTVLANLSVTLTAFPCANTLMQVKLGGGTAHFQLGPGNYWSVVSSARITVNGALTGYQIPDFSTPFLNHSNGVIMEGATIPGSHAEFLLKPGDVIAFAVTYTQTVAEFTTSTANLFSWVPPAASIVGISYPL